jgi:hypothetical protein
MKLKANAYIFGGCMLLMLFVLGWSVIVMEYFACKFLPIVISSIVFFLSAVGLGREIFAGHKQGGKATHDEKGIEIRVKSQETWQGYLLNGAWVVGFVLCLYLLGFIIAIPLFILSYMRWLGTRWRVTIACTILTPLLIYIVFELVLGIELYRGLILAYLGY